MPDRHQAGGLAFPGVEQLLTLLAYETSRVMLGSFTFVGTLVHPMKAAEQFAVIDRLSGGRLVTTVSRGFLAPFWGQFGVPEGRMLGRFQETLRIWRRAMAGERFDFEGEHWQVRGGRRRPRRRGRCGAGATPPPAAIRRSAEYATAWTSDPMPDDDWDTKAGLYRERARELGKVPFVVRMQDGWVADTRAAAHEVIGPHYARMVDFYARSDMGRTGFVARGPLGVHAGRYRRRVHRAARAPARGAGIDYVVFCCRLSTGPSLEAAREQIARFGEEVVAPVHAKYPAPDHPAIPPACRVRSPLRDPHAKSLPTDW